MAINLIENKKLTEEWNYEKNKPLTPEKFTVASNKKVWWKCANGHEWEAVISNRTVLNRGCPYCCGQKRKKGYNDIFTLNPNWSECWDYERNNIDPYSIGEKSHLKVHWICSVCGQKFSQILSTTKKKILCSKCKNEGKTIKRLKEIINQDGSLLDNYPQIAKEWNYTKNGDLKPENITSHSPRKVWWICSKGHEWEAVINSRTRYMNRCPYCSGRHAIQGETDLFTTTPTLAKEWNYEKNNLINIYPNDIKLGSGKKVWWICPKGHEWKASVTNRARLGRGCPICSSEIQTSYPEQVIAYYINKNVEAKNRYILDGKEIDIYIPSLQLGIEYDGIYFHNTDVAKTREKKKDEFFANKGIFIIRVKESDMNFYDNNKSIIFYKPRSNYKNLNSVIEELFTIISNKYNLNLRMDFDLKRDNHEILSFIKKSKKENSLAYCNKELLKEWNYEKNKNMNPEFFDISSGYKVWWKCSNGHEWYAAIYSRLKSGCPYCAGRKASIGKNDFATLNPELLKEWDYEKNNALNISPNEVVSGSAKKVWWNCPNGHQYLTAIRARAIYGYGCKYCAGHGTIKGENDLETGNPKLLKEWDYENNTLAPSEYSAHSKEKVWWKCSKGHKWEAAISNRNHSTNPTGCPYCANQKVWPGYNDLLSSNPTLAKEWNYEKNIELRPEDVIAGSKKIVWWKCSKCEYEWQEQIAKRNARKNLFCNHK